VCKQPAKKFRIVEIPIDNAASIEHPFGLEEILKDATRIVGIEAYKSGDYAYAPQSGKATVNDNVFKKAALVLGTVDGDEPINVLPLSRLNPGSNSGMTVEFDVNRINPQRCKIRLPNGANGVTNVVTTEAFVLGFYYE
jgi:hypothetical protein